MLVNLASYYICVNILMYKAFEFYFHLILKRFLKYKKNIG